MLLLPRLRLALARRPWIYWLFVACCTALIWSMVASDHAKLAEQRRTWGETQRVWVASDDVAPGDVVRSVARDYPTAMVPASAISDEPVDVIANSPIAAGEVLVASDVDAASGSVPPDWVVFALTRDHTPTVQPGSAVAIYGAGQRWCDGVVIVVGDDEVDVGVPGTCADAVSVQVASGTLVLAVVP